jgi:thiosulfate reductase cytochrome b subunit
MAASTASASIDVRERVDASGRWIYRYPLAVRAAHWTNALCLVVLVMSGLQIFNAHPALYWGEDSDFSRPLLSIGSARNPDGRPIGVTQILGRTFDTTGVLGWSRLNRRPVPRAFPGWSTIPTVQDLATGRVWHFFFAWVFVANGLMYVLHLLFSGRVSRDLVPRRQEWMRMGAEIWRHITLRFGREPGNASYNVLQKLAYLAVVLLLAPVAVLTGLTMSPAVDATVPWLVDVFGGRQSARTLHFMATGLFTLFVFVHVALVMVSGLLSNLRAMVTGWYRVTERAGSSRG